MATRPRGANVSIASFTYAPDGSRLKKTSGAATTTTTLGADIELSPTGVWTKYPHPDAVRVGTGGSAATTWLTRDHSQSIRLRTDASGALTEASSYLPYGGPLADPPPPGVALQKAISGERYDTDTGLLYLNARYMDPALARFISPDGWDPTLPGVGTNRYAYAETIRSTRATRMEIIHSFQAHSAMMEVTTAALGFAATGAAVRSLDATLGIPSIGHSATCLPKRGSA